MLAAGRNDKWGKGEATPFMAFSAQQAAGFLTWDWMNTGGLRLTAAQGLREILRTQGIQYATPSCRLVAGEQVLVYKTSK